MARTRGASNSFHQDDGVLLDREGKPIPTEALRSPEAAMQALAAVPAAEPAPEPEPAVYRCDPSTCGRDMNGWELIRVLELILGPGSMKVELGAEEYSRLHPDIKQHFARAR